MLRVTGTFACLSPESFSLRGFIAPVIFLAQNFWFFGFSDMLIFMEGQDVFTL